MTQINKLRKEFYEKTDIIADLVLFHLSNCIPIKLQKFMGINQSCIHVIKVILDLVHFDNSCKLSL